MIFDGVEIELDSDVNAVDFHELALLIERAPLGKRDPGMLETAFRNSGVVCFAYHDGKLIGTGRGLTDFVYRAALYDVAVLPEYQGKKVGKKIVEYLIAASKAPMVILFAASGKETFYTKLNFHKMKTGMMLVPDPEAARERGLIE